MLRVGTRRQEPIKAATGERSRIIDYDLIIFECPLEQPVGLP